MIFVARKSATDQADFHNDPFGVTDLGAVTSAILAHMGEAETYLSVAVYSDRWRERRNVMHTRHIWLDRDGMRLGKDVPQPTFTLETSPGRFQDFWRINSPVFPDEAEDLARRIAYASGCGFQAVAANQIVRIPGTINHGIGKGRPPSPVRVAAFAPCAIYGPGSFSHLPAAPAWIEPQVPSVRIEDGLAALRRALPYLDVRMRACAAGESITKPDGTPYHSESERDQALITALVRAGLSDNEVAAAFIESERGHMRASRKGDRYLWRRVTIEAAKARRWLTERGWQPWDGIPYIRIDSSVLDRAALLGPEGVAVMIVYAMHANRLDHAFPSQETVAAFIGCSPDLVGAQVRRLRDDHGLLERAGKVGRTQAYTLTSGESPALHIPRHIVTTLRGCGPLAVASMVLVAAQMAMGSEPFITQTQLADRLGIRRGRVNLEVGRLHRRGDLDLFGIGSRGLHLYTLGDSVVRHSGTNKNHGGGQREPSASEKLPAASHAWGARARVAGDLFGRADGQPPARGRRW